MTRRPLHVVALLATYNEERFIVGAIEHLAAQGVDVYLIDNESSDRTIAFAEPHLGRGLMGIETLPRRGEFSLTAILKRKEELAATLDADWFIHHDADEIRVPARPGTRLVDDLARADANGCNAVNFLEFTFIPTVEAPDHDHPRFRDTMRHYYPFLPEFPHRMNAWKRQPEPVELAWSAGHRVRFPGVRMAPESAGMRHYLFLSAAHAREKYSGRARARREREQGWGGWRNAVAGSAPGPPPLPRQSDLREDVNDGQLDPSAPLTAHVWNEAWAAATAETAPPA